MRFGQYAVAVVSLSLFAGTLAAPTIVRRQKPEQTKEQKEAARKKAIERAKNKYFHEPGCVFPNQVKSTYIER